MPFNNAPSCCFYFSLNSLGFNLGQCLLGDALLASDTFLRSPQLGYKVQFLWLPILVLCVSREENMKYPLLNLSAFFSESVYLMK